MMKAAELTEYGNDFKLDVKEVELPKLKNDEVLVKVKYAAVNPLDNLIGTGAIKLIQNYKTPQILGNEISGEIISVGKRVKDFNPGDIVFSRLPIEKMGGFAEYVSVPASAIAKVPVGMDLKTAAMIPLAALTAYQGLIDILKVKPGKRLFLNGGSGSLGQVLIPIAHSLGLYVIVSGNRQFRSKALMMGAEMYLDYKTMAYENLLSPVDYVIDTLGPKHYEKEISIIKKNGKLLTLQGIPNFDFAKRNHMPMWKKLLFGIAGWKVTKRAKEGHVDYHFMFVKEDGGQLQMASELIEETNFIPAENNKIFSLDEINDALEYIKHAHNGKVLIKF